MHVHYGKYYMPTGEQDGSLSSGSTSSTGSGSPPEHSQNSRGEETPRRTKRDGNTPATKHKNNKKEKIINISLYKESDWERNSREIDGTDAWRSPVRRDYARVIHSPAFRRLQGKTQLFPGHESDFFRNRLTHSIEVAQIAESIAFRINNTDEYFKIHNINPRICSVAGLIHDIGHPPFGHNGEYALDEKMRKYGGFEGNAQTLRIISRLEKKAHKAHADNANVSDTRSGLGLTYRTLASALKYDREIPRTRDNDEGIIKGYYHEARELVSKIKSAVAPEWDGNGPFKTIECAIMDIADDIAYSTYDLEDSLKAEFLTPAKILSSREDLLERVASKVSRSISDRNFNSKNILEVLFDIFSITPEETSESSIFNTIRSFEISRDMSESGYIRTEFTSQLVGEFINSVNVEVNYQCPALSKIRLEEDVKIKIETLKNYTYEATILSNRLKLSEYRGAEVVGKIFDALAGERGHLLMPDDVRELLIQKEDSSEAKMRIICDYVAGMTDRYALEFYGRLHSDTPQSIFKPV